ncbi:MAG: DUF4870 family protein [Campylobacterales bacterium]
MQDRSNEIEVEIVEEGIQRDKTLLLILYIMMLIGSIIPSMTWILGIPLLGLIAVIIAYIKKDDAENSLSASHFQNIITVFWVNLIFGFIGFITTVILIGWLILVVLFIWTMVRLLKGILRVNDGRAYV